MVTTAGRLKGQNYFTYVITGDGELEEGVIWEALMTTKKYRLGRMIVFIDNNGMQSGGAVDKVSGLYLIYPKLEAFGWHCQEIDDHNIDEILIAIKATQAETERPSIILAHTIKGQGVPHLEARTQKSYPSWGYMIDNGATTVWERWEVLRGLGMNSHNHLMLGTVDAWFYRTIAGIIPIEAGWKTIRIAPHLFDGMTHASASVDTVNGRVSSVWQRVDGELKLEVEIPVGSTAVIHIPCTHSCNDQAAQLYEQGSKAKDAEGVLSVLHDEQHYVIEVGSGIYRFSLTDN